MLQHMRRKVRPQFGASLLNTEDILKPAWGTGVGTFSRASASYLTDFEGVTRKAESGSVGVEGSRVVTNLLTYSEDLSNAAWAKYLSTTVTGTTIINLPDADGRVYVEATSRPTSTAGSTYRITATLSGSGTTEIAHIGTNPASLVVTLTSTPTRYSLTFTTPTAYVLIPSIRRNNIRTATQVTCSGIQLENVTGQTNQNPGEYVKTISAPVSKCFNTTNANTVDANGVVTGAIGMVPLPQSYPERLNETAYALNAKIEVAGWYYKCTPAGTSAGIAPPFPQGKAGTQSITDGSVVWTIGGRLLLGYVSEPASTNKVTAYGLIPADTLGSELITVEADRTFASDTTWWTKGAGWSIGSGVASRTNEGVTTDLYTPVNIATPGKLYAVTFTVTSITSGGIQPIVASGLGTLRTTTGTFTERILALVGSRLYLKGDATFAGSIDNVSIKEVTWAVGTKSFHNGAAFQQNITGLTLSGDAAAVLSIVTDETEIEKAGLANINPTFKVYKLDNSLGSGAAAVAIAGATGNTNNHSASGVVRGSGNVHWKISTGAASVSALTGSYVRRLWENKTPASSADTTVLFSNAGAVTYFLLPQLEEQPYATSINPSLGATSTRAATSLSYPTAGNIDATKPYTLMVDACLSAIGAVGTWQPAIGSDQNYAVFLRIASGTSTPLDFYNNTGDASSSLAVTDVAKLAGLRCIIRRSDSSLVIFSGGIKGSLAVLGTPTASPTVIHVGKQDNSYLNGYLRHLKIYFKSLSDAKCIALTR